MKNYFNLEVSSDLDYEGMVVNIVYIPQNNNFLESNDENIKISHKQEVLAVLNQDKGVENIEIKLYPPIGKEYWDFSYEEFIQIFKKAKKLLIQSNQDQK